MHGVVISGDGHTATPPHRGAGAVGIAAVAVACILGLVLQRPSSIGSLGAKAEMGAAGINLEGAWEPCCQGPGPSARYTHGFIFDEAGDRTVLFGGDDVGNARLDDTWELVGKHWNPVATDFGPPGRANIDQTLGYDAQRGTVLLFGGLGASHYLNDTWELNRSTWRPGPGAPEGLEPRDSHAVVFDRDRGLHVLFGGFTSGGLQKDTWAYTDGWRRVSPDVSPPARFHHALAYDDRRGVTVLFGGRGAAGALDDTWEFDGSSWRRMEPSARPAARENHAMAYHAGIGRVVLFSGETADGEVTNDVWTYAGAAWERLVIAADAGVPAPRKEAGLAYDRRQQRLVMFGGGDWLPDGLVTLGDTWLLTIAPTIRPDAAAAFLPASLNRHDLAGGAPTAVPTHTPVPSVTLPPTAIPTPSPDVLVRRVYVVAYDPMLSSGRLLSQELGWHKHADLTAATTEFFRLASGGRLRLDVVATDVITDGWPIKLDGFQYTEESYLAAYRGAASPHQPDAVDYNRIVNDPRLAICDKANAGEIDEVWLYNGPWFGFYESRLVGPDAYGYNSPPVPQPHACGRLVPLMGPSPHVPIDFAIHNFGHRAEWAMAQVFGGIKIERVTNPFERFWLVRSLVQGGAEYSGCGNIHFPPNTERSEEYRYDVARAVPSNCDAWLNYPRLGSPSDSVRPVTCADWGCTQVGFFAYWFGRLPRATGCTQGVLNDWWRYVFEPELALEPAAECP